MDVAGGVITPGDADGTTPRSRITATCMFQIPILSSTGTITMPTTT